MFILGRDNEGSDKERETEVFPFLYALGVVKSCKLIITQSYFPIRHCCWIH